MTAKPKHLEPIHPGEILLEDFLKPLDISQNRLARELDVNAARVNEIVHGRSSISAAMALRLSRFFGTSAEFWINLQSGYDLRLARRRDGERIDARVRPRESAA
jgi:addiction module HigA family antidote